jgi:toxin ParE1/3/4
VAALRPIEIRYTERAEAHIRSILKYIHEDNPAAAQRVVRAIRTAAEMLRYFPEAGRRGRSSGTREWVVRGLPYILVYQIMPAETPILVILGVFHGAQDTRKS